MRTSYRAYLIPGEIRTVWCDRCHTSAAVETTMHMVTGWPVPDGVWSAGVLVVCDRCDDIPAKVAGFAVLAQAKIDAGGLGSAYTPHDQTSLRAS